MSETEDRPDAAPAIVAPATMPAPVSAETADLEAVAAVEGPADDAPAQDEAEPVLAASAAPALLDNVGRDETPAADSAPIFDSPVFDLESFTPEPDAGRDDDAPLLDDALEAGIASVFAALQSAAETGEIGESDEPFGPLGEDEAVDGITFRLLGELDRLWHRAA